MVGSVSPSNDDDEKEKVWGTMLNLLLQILPGETEQQQQQFTNLPNVLPDGNEVHVDLEASNDFRLE